MALKLTNITKVLVAAAMAAPLLAIGPATHVAAQPSPPDLPCKVVGPMVHPGSDGVTISASVHCTVDEHVDLELEAMVDGTTVLLSETSASIEGGGALTQKTFVKAPVSEVCIRVNGNKVCVP